jgi:hypothetical protein
MRLYHTTPTVKLKRIYERGIDPAFSQCKRQEVWLHVKSRTQWAENHVKDRHKIDSVTTIAVDVPRSWLTRRRKGLWTCDRAIHFARFTDHHKFIASEVHESERVFRYLAGESVSDSPLWLAKGVPSFIGALDLALMLDIVKIGETVKTIAKENGMPAYVATVKAKCGNSTRFGAASSSDAQIATCLAYRNAVQMHINGAA